MSRTVAIYTGHIVPRYIVFARYGESYLVVVLSTADDDRIYSSRLEKRCHQPVVLLHTVFSFFY